MTTHRRYYWELRLSEGHDKVKRILDHQCEAHWWYNEPEVVGQEVGILAFSFTVSARDQWFAHKRAMGLALTCCRAVGVGPKTMPEPIWEPLAPHTNRGRFRVPAEGVNPLG